MHVMYSHRPGTSLRGNGERKGNKKRRGNLHCRTVEVRVL